MRTALLFAVLLLTSASQAGTPADSYALLSYFNVTMHVLGKEISFKVSGADLEDSPEWLDPEDGPPPFTIADAARISKTELRRYVAHPAVSSVDLRRFDERPRWFYIVEWRPLKPGHIGDGVSIPVLMNGRAIVGDVKPDTDDKKEK